jgi:PAS domain S-box-containing protein
MSANEEYNRSREFLELKREFNEICSMVTKVVDINRALEEENKKLKKLLDDKATETKSSYTFEDNYSSKEDGEVLYEATLKDKEQLEEDDYRRFFHKINEPACIVSISTIFLVTNKAFTDMLGYEPHEIEIKKMRPFDFIHPDDLDRSAKAAERGIKGTDIISFDNRYLHKNGEYIWLNWRSFKIKNKFYCIAEFGNKNQMLIKIANEIKNPVEAISGFSSILKQDEKLNHRQSTYLEKIINHVDTIKFLIEDILDISNIKLTNNKENVIVLRDMIEDIVSEFESEINGKGISVHISSKHSRSTIESDNEKLRQIFKNVISNAIKFNKINGKIEISFNYHKDTNMIDISIKDTGIGIEESRMNELYRPFNRLGIGHKYPGTGIGLAFAKKLIDVMDGKITCISEKDKFTKFIISLKCYDHIDNDTLSESESSISDKKSIEKKLSVLKRSIDSDKSSSSKDNNRLTTVYKTPQIEEPDIRNRFRHIINSDSDNNSKEQSNNSDSASSKPYSSNITKNTNNTLFLDVKTKKTIKKNIFKKCDKLNGKINIIYIKNKALLDGMRKIMKDNAKLYRSSSKEKSNKTNIMDANKFNIIMLRLGKNGNDSIFSDNIAIITDKSEQFIDTHLYRLGINNYVKTNTYPKILDKYLKKAMDKMQRKKDNESNNSSPYDIS